MLAPLAESSTLHEALAHYLEALPGERDVFLLAFHYGKSCHHDKQREYFQLACQAAEAHFANDTALANRNKQGFPWGLLGLLGLLGLIPLFRGNGRVRTVYVERDDTPRRVVRERIEEE